MHLGQTTFALVVFALTPFTARAAEPGATNAIPLIVIENVPLVDAIKNLARQAGLNYILDPSVARLAAPGQPVTRVNLRWTNTSAPSALSNLLQIQKLTNVTDPVTSVTRIASANPPITVKATNQMAATGTVIPVIAVEDAPLAEVIQNLATAAKINVVVDSKVKSTAAFRGPERISFHWERITAKQALMALLDNYGFLLVEEPASGVTRVMEKQP